MKYRAHLGILLLWSSEFSEQYFDALMVVLAALSYFRLSLFVFLDLLLGRTPCPQQPAYLSPLAPSIIVLLKVSPPAFSGTRRTFFQVIYNLTELLFPPTYFLFE